MATTDELSMLKGRLDLDDLPPHSPTHFKVYICSNVNDMQVEQSEFMNNVYPKLRKFCRSKHGVDFHALDTRWSVMFWPKSNVGCLLYESLIEKCREMSLGPNFVGLIGQRLGQSYLPSLIPVVDFEVIRQSLIQARGRAAKEAPLLDMWYVKDENMTYPAYVLQNDGQSSRTSTPRGAMLTSGGYSFGDQEPTWERIQCILRRLLQRGIDLSLQNQVIFDPETFDFLTTDFERELRLGLRDLPGPDANCIVCMRTIVDLKNYASEPTALKFAELSCGEEDGEKAKLDDDSQTRLASLKEAVVARVPSELCVCSSILWKFPDGVDARLHKDYLKNLSETFHCKMEDMLEKCPDPVSPWSCPVSEEVHQHWLIAKQLTTCFVGMEDALELIKSYVVSSEERPLVVYGQAGTGKSTILAKAATEASRWLSDCETISIVRFLGTTTDSTEIRQLLLSLCLQIRQAIGQPCHCPASYEDLVACFCQTLNEFPDGSCLVLFLDGIERLEQNYEPASAATLDWLPQRFKENVKVVLSVPDGPLLETLRNQVIRRANNFLEMPLLLPEDCRTLMNWKLATSYRRLTEKQETEVFEKCFAYCAPPLLVMLVCSVVEKWTSFGEGDVDAVPDDVKTGVEGLFDRMEGQFGAVFVGRALAVLTASRKGLTDCEAEDLLSMDDAAFKAVDERSESRIPRRIPPLAWQRIRHEIRHFLLTVVCENETLVNWNNRIFAETVRRRYINEEKTRIDLHSLLADYWMGDRATSGDVAVVVVPDQPLIFREEDVDCGHPVPLYNLRKFDQLPVQLNLAGRTDDLNRTVLFRFEWIYHKTKAFSLEHVISDYSLGKGFEARITATALRDAAFFVDQSVSVLAAELTGRLLGYYSGHSHIHELIDQCDRLGVDYCALVPTFAYRQMPRLSLMHVVECVDFPTQGSVVGEREELLLVKDATSSYIEVAHLEAGYPCGRIPASVGSVTISRSGRHAAVVDYERDKTVKLHSLETGKFLGHVVPVNHITLCAKDKQQLTHLCLSDTRLCLAISAESNWLCIADVPGCVMCSVLDLPKAATVCEMTPDSRYVFVNTGTTLLSYDLETSELINNTVFEEVPRLITFTDDGCLGFIVGEQASGLMKMGFMSGKIEFRTNVELKPTAISDCIVDLRVSRSQQLLLLRSPSTLVVYNIAEDRPLCHIDRPNEVPSEFRFPNSTYFQLCFTDAKFAGTDDKYLAAAIFRDVLIWQIASNSSSSSSSCRLVSRIRTPVGMVQSLYTTGTQIITTAHGSKLIHVWSLQDSLTQVDVLDCLTSPVNRVVVTDDDAKVFVTCDGSDEVGIFDLRTGELVDLLTHEAPVVDLSISAGSGQFAVVSLDRTKPNQFNKLWNTTERRYIEEFGRASAVAVYSAAVCAFLVLLQDQRGIKDPFLLRLYKHSPEGCFEELRTDIEIAYVLQKPFLTAEDNYMVVLSACDYDHSTGHYVDPCICAVSLKTPVVTMTTFTPSGLRCLVPCLRRILGLRPCPRNPYNVVVFYTNEPDAVGECCRRSRNRYEHNYGFAIVDLCSAVVCQLIDDFLPPTVALTDVLFTRDVRLCVDDRSNLYDMSNGHFLSKLLPAETPRPLRLAMADTVAVYADGEYIMVVRITDRKCLGRLSVHGDIRALDVAHDDRTIVVGCCDGSVVSHVIVDVDVDDRSEVIGRLATRKSRYFGGGGGGGGAARVWDKVNVGSAPEYSRPPSAMVPGVESEREVLQRVRPLNNKTARRSRQQSTTAQLYDMSRESKTCSVM